MITVYILNTNVYPLNYHLTLLWGLEGRGLTSAAHLENIQVAPAFAHFGER